MQTDHLNSARDADARSDPSVSSIGRDGAGGFSEFRIWRSLARLAGNLTLEPRFREAAEAALKERDCDDALRVFAERCLEA